MLVFKTTFSSYPIILIHENLLAQAIIALVSIAASRLADCPAMSFVFVC